MRMIKLMLLITLTFGLTLGVQSYLFYKEVDSLKDRVSSLETRVVELKKPKEAVQVFYDQFNAAIDVYDENVEIYNQHFAKLDKDIEDMAQIFLNHMKRTEGM